MRTNTERTRTFRQNRKEDGTERQINIWLPTSTLARLDAIAAKRDLSRRQLIANLIEREPT